MSKKLILVCILISLSAQVLAAGPPYPSPSELPGGLYLSTPPTLLNGQTSINMMDANGNLKVTISGETIPISITPAVYTPLAPDCKLSVTGGTATPITSCSGGVPATANYVLVCNEGSTARWSQTTTPTTSTGQLLPGPGTDTPASATCTTFGPSPPTAISALRFIEQTGSGTSVLNFSFYLYQ